MLPHSPLYRFLVSGGSVRLHCSVTNVEDSGVSWIRLSDYQILTNGLATFTSDRRFRLLHAPGGSEWTLELLSVAEKDEGGYQCQVRTEETTPGEGTVMMVTQMNFWA